MQPPCTDKQGARAVSQGWGGDSGLSCMTSGSLLIPQILWVLTVYCASYRLDLSIPPSPTLDSKSFVTCWLAQEQQPCLCGTEGRSGVQLLLIQTMNEAPCVWSRILSLDSEVSGASNS